MTGWVMAEHGVAGSRLTVLYLAPKKKKGERKWVCQCSCEKGTIVEVPGSRLRSGETRSCGCLQKDLARERHSKENEYDLTNHEYGIGYTTNTHEPFYFDLDDYQLIKQYHWQQYVNKERSNHVDVRAYYKDENGKRQHVLMHQLITGAKKMDHENQNPMDNRRSNLRVASNQQNSANCPLQRNNKSGFTGVYWHKNRNKWVATIKINYKSIEIGAFDNKQDAIISRLKAEQMYFGEFAPQRHLFDEFGIATQN